MKLVDVLASVWKWSPRGFSDEAMLAIGLPRVCMYAQDLILLVVTNDYFCSAHLSDRWDPAWVSAQDTWAFSGIQRGTRCSPPNSTMLCRARILGRKLFQNTQWMDHIALLIAKSFAVRFFRRMKYFLDAWVAGLQRQERIGLLKEWEIFTINAA